ncbi:MAG: GNAT family N-acetyltransferase [Spirochaetaceae bacterium]|jgi:RimJ/RimL family protein N-acetyltransferase|nr:GNAT family N-acetyltransferase [Spirochaetaceae bacterium]
MIVRNKRGGALELNIRLARESDAPDIAGMIMKQHGVYYWSGGLSNVDFLRGAIKSGDLLIAVAELLNGALAGITGANRKTALEGAIELNMLIVQPKFRGFALGKHLHNFLLETGALTGCACVYTHCMTLDNASQRICAYMGHRFTGMLFNYHRFDGGAENIAGAPLPYKGSGVVSCLPVDKKNAGEIYAPLKHAAFIEDVYHNLAADFTIMGEPEPKRPAASRCSVIVREKHRYCEALIEAIGGDAEEQIKRALENCGTLPGDSFNAFINLNDPACPGLYDNMEKLGFVFSGLHPLTNAGEYMILYYAPGFSVDFEKIAVINEFSPKIAYIRGLFDLLQDSAAFRAPASSAVLN